MTASSFGRTTERSGDAALAFDGDEPAIAALLRGHLEITGITTVDELAQLTTLTPSRVTAGLAYLEQTGFVLQGQYTEHADATEWVARRLLARIHSYSRRTRRGGVEPATAQDFMRFLLRWQHVAPGTQLVGDAGLLTIIEQLQGFDAAAVAWEPELLGRRMRRYEPGWLDRLCHDGDVAWLRLNPPTRDADAPSVAPRRRLPRSPWCAGPICPGCSPRRVPPATRPNPRSEAPPRFSKSCGSGERASRPSWAMPRTAFRKMSSGRSGTALPGDW